MLKYNVWRSTKKVHLGCHGEPGLPQIGAVKYCINLHFPFLALTVNASTNLKVNALQQRMLLRTPYRNIYAINNNHLPLQPFESQDLSTDCQTHFHLSADRSERSFSKFRVVRVHQSVCCFLDQNNRNKKLVTTRFHTMLD